MNTLCKFEHFRQKYAIIHININRLFGKIVQNHRF